MSMKAFGDSIREARERKQVRAYDLAFRLGQSPSWVSKLESGDLTYPPAPSVIDGLSRELEIPPGKMLADMGYRIGEEERPAYDPEVDRVARAVAKLSPAQRRLLLGFIDSVTARVDAVDPPDDEG